MLTRSVRSLREQASDPGSVEILVAHDPDDPDTGETARELGAAVVWQAPYRYGYAESARYYAALLGFARGQWLLPSWGDDAVMLTGGWDDLVRSHSHPAVLYTTGGDRWGNNCFPIVSTSVFEATGRFCPLPAVDTWYDEVGALAGIHVRPSPPIVLMQDRFDLTGRNRDATYVEGRGGYRAEEFFSDQAKAWRQADAADIRTWQAREITDGQN